MNSPQPPHALLATVRADATLATQIPSHIMIAGATGEVGTLHNNPLFLSFVKKSSLFNYIISILSWYISNEGFAVGQHPHSTLFAVFLIVATADLAFLFRSWTI